MIIYRTPAAVRAIPVQSLPEDADVSSPAIGITFGMIRNARRAELEEANAD